MSHPAVIHEFEHFVQFATRCINEGSSAASVEELVELWRLDAESAAVIADVRQGLIDHQNGLGEPAKKTFADLRRRLGMTP